MLLLFLLFEHDIAFTAVERLHQAPWLYFYSCSTQLSTKFIMFINVKMPTIVGILTFISMLNATSESLKQKSSYFLAV